MANFNITSHVVDGGRKRIDEIIAWLTENVGHYFGRGDDPVIHLGAGWVIAYSRDIDWEENYVTEWVVGITDDAKASLFALKWI
jgi:hypothetical protein